MIVCLFSDTRGKLACAFGARSTHENSIIGVSRAEEHAREV